MARCFLLTCLVVFLLCSVCVAQREGKDKKKGKTKTNPQKIALEKWALSLTPTDYEYEQWRIMFHSRSTVDFFNGYAKRLSNLFKDNNAKVNFVMIGKQSDVLFLSFMGTSLIYL